VTLVIDELERLDGAEGPVRLVEALVRGAPDPLRIVLATRTGLPFPVARLRDSDTVHEIGARDLQLDEAAATAVVRDRWPDLADATAAEQLVAVAGGHPATLVMTAAACRRLGSTTIATIAPDQSSPERAAARLLSALDPRDRALVEVVSVLGDTSATELRTIGHDVDDAHVRELVADHVLDAMPGSPARLRVARLVAEHVVPSAELAAATCAAGARAALAGGDPTRSLQIVTRHGSDELLARTLDEIGSTVIDHGAAGLVLDAIRRLPDPVAEPRASLAGRAAQALGDWDAAIAHYERAARTGRMPAADAWRHGLMLHLRGDIPAAMRAYAVAGEGRADLSDTALLAAFRGAAAWLTGDLDTARRCAEDALTSAARCNDDRALAASYTLAAMVAAADGDRVSNDWYYVRALQHAERAADPLQVARIRSNRGSRLLEEGDYASALAELDAAVRNADLGGFGAVLALALSNRGEVKTRIGRLDEARDDLATSIELLQRQGSRLVAYPTTVLARLFLTRGDLEQARSACERALALAGPTGDRQVATVARVLLALALADREPDEAWELANAAAAEAAGSLNVAEAWVAVGRLALARDLASDASEAAARAAELARSRRDRWALAGAIEVGALADRPGDGRRSRLLEARALYEELGCPIDVARLELELAALDRPDVAAGRLRAVAETAHRVGARALSNRADQLLRAIDRGGDTALRAGVLGAFTLVRDGEVVPNTAWQSRKARDLFKMLLTRRGRAVAREQAMERLWPGENDPKLASRLAVAVATVRAVLDPAKRFDGEHFVKADGDSLRVDLGHLELDVDRFLAAADAALVEHRRGDGRVATGMLAAAEALYTGDVLEDDPYVDWHVALREEARAAYLAVATALADRRSAGDDPDAAIRLLLRVLEREPYDEASHVRLVALLSRAGRHGEARRRFQSYVDRMRELDLEPRPFAAVVRGDEPV
jgi:DNA-binding SARP family transcriptional activator/ATP/maltotriose-dependent transcriptional regulator MalT